MLINLHVKNLALIDEADIDFSRGLQVVTGETGAGKSLLLGSINIALGAKVAKDIIRNGSDYALVELTFSMDQASKERLREADINTDDETVVVSRKIMENRSVSKINGETVNLSTLKNIMTSLIDIHGQHEHQSLLNKSKHLEILDKFAETKLGTMTDELKMEYREYQDLKSKLSEFDMDENARIRELEFASFEASEIDEAGLLTGEDDELEKEYKSSKEGQAAVENLNSIESIFSDQDGLKDLISKCIQLISGTQGENCNLIKDQLYNIEALMQDVSRDIYDSLNSCVCDPERLKEIEDRLDIINHLKMKYGQSIEEILKYRDEKQAEIDRLSNYENSLNEIKENIEKKKKIILNLCEKISDIRKEAALRLEKEVTDSLLDLNFLQVVFKISVEKKSEKDGEENFSDKGFDNVEFLISTNPGEDVRPLGKVASGGELSRIMLAIKSILANEDDVDALIFDEIDTGISGRTAIKVAEKLALISRSRQVICISHLAQIASMADNHYLIEKNIKDNETFTEIKELDYESSIKEITRISNGDLAVSDSAKALAREMKEKADGIKLKLKNSRR